MKNNKKGFTLVELLAVIVILGVLLLVAVPAVNNIMKTSKEKAAKDNALMVIKAFETCNMATQTTCTSTQLADYMENSSSTVAITVDASGNLTSFKITGFNGYNIELAGTNMTTAAMKAAINGTDFTGNTLTKSGI